MADYLKLFMERRLNPAEPHHLEYIKGRLAAMKAEGKEKYDEYSTFYGVGMQVQEVKPKKK